MYIGLFEFHWTLPEKKNGVREVEDMEFPGVLKKWQVDLLGVN